MQLFILYIVILFTIDGIKDYQNNIFIVLLESLFILIMYILLTKQELIYFIITTTILLIQQLVYNRLNININLKDTELSEEETIELNNTIKIYTTVNRILLFMFSLVLLYGITTYFIKQYKTHRKNSKNIFEFIIKFLLEGNKSQKKKL